MGMEEKQDAEENAKQGVEQKPALNKSGNRRGMHNAGKEFGDPCGPGESPSKKKAARSISPRWLPVMGPPEPPDMLTDLEWVRDHFEERFEGEPKRLAMYREMAPREIVDRIIALSKQRSEERRLAEEAAAKVVASEADVRGPQQERVEALIEKLLAEGEASGWKV